MVVLQQSSAVRLLACFSSTRDSENLTVAKISLVMPPATLLMARLPFIKGIWGNIFDFPTLGHKI